MTAGEYVKSRLEATYTHSSTARIGAAWSLIALRVVHEFPISLLRVAVIRVFVKNGGYGKAWIHNSLLRNIYILTYISISVVIRRIHLKATITRSHGGVEDSGNQSVSSTGWRGKDDHWKIPQERFIQSQVHHGSSSMNFTDGMSAVVVIYQSRRAI